MSGQPPDPPLTTRTGEFFFKVWQRSQKSWDWHMRIQVMETGEWSECDSIQEAVWIMHQCLRVEADVEPAVLPEEGDCLEDEDVLEEPVLPRSIGPG
jgi:hypothetical protein